MKRTRYRDEKYTANRLNLDCDRHRHALAALRSYRVRWHWNHAVSTSSTKASNSFAASASSARHTPTAVGMRSICPLNSLWRRIACSGGICSAPEWAAFSSRASVDSAMPARERRAVGPRSARVMSASADARKGSVNSKGTGGACGGGTCAGGACDASAEQIAGAGDSGAAVELGLTSGRLGEASAAAESSCVARSGVLGSNICSARGASDSGSTRRAGPGSSDGFEDDGGEDCAPACVIFAWRSAALADSSAA